MSTFGINGTDVWRAGPKVTKRSGRYTEIGVESDAAAEGFRPDVRYDCNHKLRGDERCLSCGRTKNEIALDGDR